MAGQEAMMQATLGQPDIIKRSTYDSQVNLYYRKYETSQVATKYLVVIVKIDNSSGFILTSFYTDKIKIGETVWER